MSADARRTLVFIHGFLGSSLNWSPILFKLRADPTLTAWDFRAVDLLWHGKRMGPEDPDACNIETMVDDLQEQLQDLPQFFALGHSFGLRPLLKLAHLQPQRVLGIIAEDSGPDLSGQGTADLRKVLTEVPVPFASRAAAKEFLDQSFGAGTAMARFLLSNIRERSPGVHTWRFQPEPLKMILAEALKNPAYTEWSEYRGPVEMVKGSLENSFVTPERLKKYLELRKNRPTELHQIEQAGHWVHSEQPESFTACLVKILKKFEQVEIS